MPKTLVQKLRIKEGQLLLTINAPSDFKNNLEGLPASVKISDSLKSFDQIHWFVKDKAQVQKDIEKVTALIKKEIICWIYYPKRSSKIQTDLNRDSGWEELMKYDHLQWLSLLSFNETWSAFAMRAKNDVAKQQSSAPVKREIFDYVDANKKTVRLPEDFNQLLLQHKKEKQFFDQLSFTNKKEYVEWIITARRQETRATRLKESIARLGNSWKNPNNR